MERNKKKVKKSTTIITLSTSLALLIVCLLLPRDTVFYDVSLALLGSDLIAAVLSIIEYFTILREVTEEFYLASLKALSTIEKIKYLNFDTPDDLVKKCLSENENNNNKTISYIIGEKHNAKEEYLKLHGYDPEKFRNDSINQWYNEKLDKFKTSILSIAKIYIIISKMDLSMMTYYYGKFDSFIANKSLRSFIYNEIYKKAWDTRSVISQEAYHFNLLLENKGNIVVCIEKIRDLENKLLRIEESENDQLISFSVYNEVADQLEDSLEKLISYTRKGRTIESNKHSTIYSQLTPKENKG